MTRTAIILIALNAGVAIAILLGGDMGGTGGDILGTSLLATGTALLVMVLVPAMRDSRIGASSYVAAIAAVIGFVIVTLGIWTSLESDFGWKSAGSAYTIAVGGATASVLAGVELRGRARWIGAATLIAVGIASAMIVVAIWGEVDSSGFWRAFAVVGVLIAAGALAIPILGSGSAGSEAKPSEPRIYHCPFCGARTGPQQASGAHCPACSRRFDVVLHSEAGDEPA